MRRRYRPLSILVASAAILYSATGAAADELTTPTSVPAPQTVTSVPVAASTPEPAASSGKEIVLPPQPAAQSMVPAVPATPAVEPVSSNREKQAAIAAPATVVAASHDASQSSVGSAPLILPAAPAVSPAHGAPTEPVAVSLVREPDAVAQAAPTNSASVLSQPVATVQNREPTREHPETTPPVTLGSDAEAAPPVSEAAPANDLVEAAQPVLPKATQSLKEAVEVVQPTMGTADEATQPAISEAVQPVTEVVRATHPVVAPVVEVAHPVVSEAAQPLPEVVEFVEPAIGAVNEAVQPVVVEAPQPVDEVVEVAQPVLVEAAQPLRVVDEAVQPAINEVTQAVIGDPIAAVQFGDEATEKLADVSNDPLSDLLVGSVVDEPAIEALPATGVPVVENALDRDPITSAEMSSAELLPEEPFETQQPSVDVVPQVSSAPAALVLEVDLPAGASDAPRVMSSDVVAVAEISPDQPDFEDLLAEPLLVPVGRVAERPAEQSFLVASAARQLLSGATIPQSPEAQASIRPSDSLLTSAAGLSGTDDLSHGTIRSATGDELKAPSPFIGLLDVLGEMAPGSAPTSPLPASGARAAAGSLSTNAPDSPQAALSLAAALVLVAWRVRQLQSLQVLSGLRPNPLSPPG